MKKNRIKLTESQLHRVIKESVNKILKESAYNEKQEAYKIWDTYLQIQKQIEEENCNVECFGHAIELTGVVNGKEWYVDVYLNPYDQFSPSLDSENVHPFIDGKEVWTNNRYNKYSNEALKAAEEKYGIEYKSIIKILGGGGDFPQWICDIIDNYEEDDY